MQTKSEETAPMLPCLSFSH